MKIVSPFSDFYDYVIQSNNELYYDRKELIEKEVKKLNSDINIIYLENQNVDMKNKNHSYFFAAILRIGHRYIPILGLFHLTEEYDKLYEYFYTYEQFMNYVKDKVSNYKLDSFVKHKNKFEEYFNQKINDDLFEIESPISLYYIHQTINAHKQLLKSVYKTHHNIQLKSINFHMSNVMPVEEIYQEIEMFLSSKYTEKTVLIKDDIIVRDSKGFNKESFKNIKRS